MTEVKVSEINGLLLVDKPLGWTSHDVVNCVRRRFKLKKVGHCGTLDPNATGLLVLVIGKATKLSQNFTNTDKSYTGIMRLGVETTTQDAEGDITAEKDYRHVTEEQAAAVFRKFTGEIWQTPPMVSAVKINGQRLYKMARQGKTVEREPRQVEIHRLAMLNFEPPDINFEMECSKGTYVRTLCADIGAQLGSGAYLHELRRTSAGTFNVRNAYTTDAVKSWRREELPEHMIPIEQAIELIIVPQMEGAGDN